MVREDLVDGAVTFLQDASVASAPLEQKISFLRSKNLTQEEIDASLARAGQPASAQPGPPTGNYPPQYRPPPQQYGGYQYSPPYWAQPPPEVPRRDWRDWFIMATVTSGLGYGLYWTAKRYILPLIAPPTPPQLEQDKASVDASFEKAFALLEQLSADTQELKDAEKARTQRLDQALEEVESVVSRLKETTEARERESRRTASELDEIKEEIPRAIRREKDTTDGRLKDLAVEMQSLKTLTKTLGSNSASRSFGSTAQNGTNGTSVSGSAPTQSLEKGTADSGSSAVDAEGQPSPALPGGSVSGNPYQSRLLGGKAQIPSWQLAAKKHNTEAKQNPAEEQKEQGPIESGSPEQDNAST